MDRIDTPGSVGGFFRFGNPFALPPILSTIVGAAWLNGIQEELATYIESEGITLDKLDNTQLRASITASILALVQSGGGITDDFVSAPYTGSAGDGVLIVDCFGVAVANFTIGNPVTLQLTGEFTLTKRAGIGEDILEGAAVYWDDAAREIKNAPGVAHLVGYATAASGDVAPTVNVRLNGVQRDQV